MNTEIPFDYSLNHLFVHKYVYSKEGCRRTIANKTVDKRKESKHKNNIEKKNVNSQELKQTRQNISWEVCHTQS